MSGEDFKDWDPWSSTFATKELAEKFCEIKNKEEKEKSTYEN